MITNPSTLLKFNRLFSQTSKFAFSKGGNLYTWGLYSSGTGYEKNNYEETILNPKRVEEFDGNVAKVSMGYYHSCVLTTKGELYSCGTG